MRSGLVTPSSWSVQFDVLRALVLRDIKTRFFGNGLGYIVAVLWPTTHVIILLGIYIIVGRVAPLGDSTAKFLSIALVPVISYMYMSRFIMMSSMMNRPLMNYPIVTLFDIILARAILESATSFFIAVIISAGLFALDISIAPGDAPQAAYAFLSALAVGLGVGSINAIIVFKLPGWILPSLLVNIIAYITSGVLFMPNALPEIAQHVVDWNPVLHSVEWMREAYYPEYTSHILSKSYPFAFGGICIVLALATDRFLRRYLRS